MKRLCATCGVISFLLLAASSVTLANHEIIGVRPNFTADGEPPEAYVVDLGSNLVLPCGVTGTPPITVSWFREGDSDEINSTFVMDGTLSIRVTEAEANDTAAREGTNYYCVATNRIGPGYSIVATLRSRNVSVSSSFFGGFQRTEVGSVPIGTIVGGDVALECDFNASNPTPTVTWFANDVMIQQIDKILFLEGGRYLYIPVLTAAERMMRYRCEINNFRDENGMPIRAPTTYTLNTDLASVGITVYNQEVTVSGRVGEQVQLVYAAAARDTNGNNPDVAITCPDNPLVVFGRERPGPTIIPATLTAAAGSENQVNFTCQLFAPPPTSPEDVMGTIIVTGPPANITNPVRDDPSLIDREQRVGVGGAVVYTCDASGSPDPTITWYYNGTVVPPGSAGVVVGGDGTLTISAPQVNNSGIYQCFARNQFGEDSRTWILEVRDPVIEIVLTSTFEIMENSQGKLFLLAPFGTENLVITATVESTSIRGVANTCDSCPDGRWQINGTDIENENDLGFTFSDPCNDSSTCSPYTFTLTVPRLTSQTSGDYSAIFSTLDVTASQELRVTVRDVSRVSAITGAEEPLDVDDELELQCMFREILPTTVSWFKDGIRLSNNSRVSISPVMNDMSTLTIRPLTMDDGGDYTCTTTSDAGSDSRVVNVEVRQESSNGNIGGIIGGAVGGSVGAIVGISVAVIVVMIIILKDKKKCKPNNEEDGSQKKGSHYSDPPRVAPDPASRKAQEAGSMEMEATDQGATYADPQSIQHETAAETGAEYAVSSKIVSTKKGGKASRQVEAPTGDLYSVPDKTKKQDLTYAEVEARPPKDHLNGNKQYQDSVTYSELTHEL